MRPSRRLIECFIALAVLRGIATAALSRPYCGAWDWKMSTAATALDLPGALFLFACCALRRYRMPDVREWLTILFLAIPVWLDGIGFARGTSWVHSTGWGDPFLIHLAAPLWLALLAALHLVRVEVPRVVVGAGIVGIAATLLLVPTEAFSFVLNQMPTLVLDLLFALLTVVSWDVASRGLARLSFIASASAFLLLLGLVHASLLGFSCVVLHETAITQSVDWHSLALVWPLQLCVYMGSTCLWFYLLTRLSLPAFSMNALAEWTAGTAGGLFFFTFLSWRVDLALTIAVTAIVVALRARLSDEQPTALGLHST